MTIYLVNPNAVTNIYPDGFQSDTSLYNLGPTAIWVGDTTSLTSDNGYKLPPLCTVEWRARRPLYAKTNNNTARLQVDLSALRANNNRDNVFTLLDSQIMPTNTAFKTFNDIEVGSYRSLRIIFDVAAASSSIQVHRFTIFWYDLAMNVMEWEQFSTFCSPNSAATVISSIKTPVKGLIARIQIANENLTGGQVFFINPFKINVYGSTNYESHSSYVQPRALLSPFNNSGVLTENSYHDRFFGTTGNNQVLLPHISDEAQVSLRFSVAPTTAGVLGFFDPSVPDGFTSFTNYPVGASFATYNGIVPLGKLNAIYCDTLPGSCTLTVNWKRK